MTKNKKDIISQLKAELQETRHRLFEANETIEAIRLGKVDALVVESDNGNQLYTLKTADQLYRIFIEKMAEGAVTLSKDGLILFCNSQFASMLKLPLTEILGRTFKEFVPETCIAGFEVIFRQSWEADSKHEFQLKSGADILPVQLSFSSFTLENETILSLIITDLTSQKIAQEQLELANRLLGDSNNALENSNHDLQQFASVASHDMQEPLRKIQILLNYILDRESGKLSGQTALQMNRVMQAASRMRHLVVDVLDFSRLSAEEETFTTIVLDDIIKEVLEDLELLIREKGASIQSGPLCIIQGNKGQIRRVFQNLIVNALKFSKPEQSPTIEISGNYISDRSFDAPFLNKGPFCLIRIKDNGIGFDEAYGEKIFSLFTRLHTKDRYEGTGIGLAIARKIVEKHGGLIRAHGRKNEGAEFQILLPVSQHSTVSDKAIKGLA